jgi:hypothetical protein
VVQEYQKYHRLQSTTVQHCAAGFLVADFVTFDLPMQGLVYTCQPVPEVRG